MTNGMKTTMLHTFSAHAPSVQTSVNVAIILMPSKETRRLNAMTKLAIVTMVKYNSASATFFTISSDHGWVQTSQVSRLLIPSHLPRHS